VQAKPPTKEEIEGLRQEAKERLCTVAKAVRLVAGANRKAAAFEALLHAMIDHRARQLGISADRLSLEDVFVSADERALVRLHGIAVMEAGAAESLAQTIDQDDSIDRVIARLAAERGWTPMDAARAILGNASAKADEIRGAGPHQKARRVRQAVEVAIRATLDRVDRELAGLDGGKATEAAATIVIGAALAIFTGHNIGLDDMRRVLRAEKERLTAALDRRARRRPGGE
jgi:hypothetical protein